MPAIPVPWDLNRAVDPHSFCADPDQAVLLNADRDPTAFLIRIRIQQHKIINKLPESFLELKKKKNIAQKKKRWTWYDKKITNNNDQFIFLFFLFCPSPSWIRIQEGKWMQIRIHSPGFETGTTASKVFLSYQSTNTPSIWSLCKFCNLPILRRVSVSTVCYIADEPERSGAKLFGRLYLWMRS